MKLYHKSIVPALIILPLLMSCMGPRKLSTNQTFLNLEPAEQLPVYDLANVPVNFEATIENVADIV